MLAVVLLFLGFVGGAHGHGYLLFPPSRSSMWRLGFKTPINYNDMALNCGGYGNELFRHNGKCGVCGDPYGQPQPRDNEAGGKYGLGIISRHYQQGQDLPITIFVTANYKGYFEFRLCKNDDVKKIVNQDCLDKGLMVLKNANGTRYYLRGTSTGRIDLTAILPAGLTCSQCVLQWKWHAGNNYGVDNYHHECRGCGPQEEFYGCSDISIGGSGWQTPPPGVTIPEIHTPPPTQVPGIHTPPPTQAPVVTNQPTVQGPTGNYGAYSTCHALNNWAGFEKLDMWCVENCYKGSCPQVLCSCPDVANLGGSHIQQAVAHAPNIILSGSNNNNNLQWVSPTPTRITGHNEFDSCRGTGLWAIGMVALDNWCIQNCAVGNCPSVQCYCPTLHGPHVGHTDTPHTLFPPTTRTPPVIFINPSTRSPPVVSVPPTTKSPLTVYPPTTRSPPIVYTPTTRSPPIVYVSPTLRPPSIVYTTKRQNVILGGNSIPELSPTRASGHGRFDSCHGVGLWGLGIPALDNWCVENCARGNCPSMQCYCPGVAGHIPKTTRSPVTTKAPTQAPIIRPVVTPAPRPSVTPQVLPQITPSHHPATAVPPVYSKCRGVNNWQGVPQLTEWCQRSCSMNYCPSEMCDCSQ